ncbi:hypothetical protein FOL47_001778 [Perkinsus chesapeaki]|uniref:Uncharacterized protein n=1 Tax=Perkinsus chesapeaki TaxID=330153 RepID=A0A7J6MH46_PERCH|nr:hypothetical protein FOL47_001778 [Perkinsus chesapeaki]
MPTSTLVSYMVAITLLTVAYTGIPPVPQGYFCSDQASEEKTDIRFGFLDSGVPVDCQECRGGIIDVMMHDRRANMSESDFVIFYYTLNNTANGLRIFFPPDTYLNEIKRLLGRLNLSTTMWDDGLPFLPGGPFGEDSLIIPITEDVNATLTYSNCPRGLTRNQAHTGYCSLHNSNLLYDIHLQFFPSDCSPFMGWLGFIQEKSGGAPLERIGLVGWQFSGTGGFSRITLFKTNGADLSQFLGIESLGNSSAVRTYNYWLDADRIWYDFQFDKVFVNLSEIVEFSPC